MDILDIFYNEVIKEAAQGKITNYFTYNIIFNTFIKEENKLVEGSIHDNDLIVPYLNITDKDLFNKLLVEYVILAEDFYKNSKYLQELKNENINYRKNILAMLWSNATFEDFSNPLDYLKRRINFLSSLKEYNINCGYVSLFESTIEVDIKKDEIFNETPYQMQVKLTNLDGLVFNFPSIKFGISDNVLYVYAIQNKINEENYFTKKINRLLFKTNKEFDEETKPEIYGVDNLKDVSMSFLIVTNIFLSYIKSLNIDKVVVSSILISRWNAKRILINKRYKNSERYYDEIKEQERIQHNLTEKLIRTFMRLSVHYDGLKITSNPFDIDSNMHLNIGDMNNPNNEILDVTFNLFDNKNRNL